MTRVLGVHGVGNFLADLPATDSAAVRAKEWGTALGLPGIDMRVAYYADLLNAEIAQGSGLGLLPEPAREMLASWALALGAPDEVTQGPATAIPRQIVSWVCRRFNLENRAVEWFIAEFFPEVVGYLRDPDPVRARVAAALREHRPQVVIAHSLGSVVTFETLCAHEDLSVDLLITLGSPLALPYIHNRLAFTVKRPPRAGRWLNLADIGDLVAVPRKLGGLFEVDSHHELTIALFAFHAVERYLAHTAVRSIVQ
ncbi:serine peptidase [Allorhizocola rhizosphaerae]|uniref:serine peptidase n=1 Tax=Allorhizocola rhizosphaerae TaxID=1872709 RepID=UPI000E3D43DC|nr:serine peptidase [Allorhizocola rhizosphaerae]